MSADYRIRWIPLWVPSDEASLAALREQHQRVFPGNRLSISGGYIKVAVPKEELDPLHSLSSEEVAVERQKQLAAAQEKRKQ